MVWTGTKCAKPGDLPHQCDRKDQADCAAQCDKGHAGSCLTLGQLLVWTPTPDEKRAFDLFDKACKAHEARGCFEEALSKFRQAGKDPSQKTQLNADGMKLGEQACSYGDGYSCSMVGLWYQWGTLAPKDLSKSVSLMKRSCDLGYSWGCLSLANDLILGDKGIAKDTAAASALLSRACESGNSAHCDRLGVAYQKGEIGPKDPQKALEAFDKACRLGGLHSCTTAGQMLRTGDGVKADAAKAKDFFEHGCPEKIGSDSCVVLGEMYEKGDGVGADKSKAVDLYFRGCFSGGCTRASALVQKGDVKVDDARALEIYKKTCTVTGVSGLFACDAYGSLLEKSDRDQAKAHYLKMCTERLDQPSCDSLKRAGGAVPDGTKAQARAAPKK